MTTLLNTNATAAVAAATAAVAVEDARDHQAIEAS